MNSHNCGPKLSLTCEDVLKGAREWAQKPVRAATRYSITLA